MATASNAIAYNIKQAGGLKASPMQVWSALALLSLTTSEAQTKQLNNLPVIYWQSQKLFCKPSANSTTSLGLGLLSTN